MYYAALGLLAAEGLRPGSHQRTWALLERRWRDRSLALAAYLSAYDAARARRRQADYEPAAELDEVALAGALRAAGAMIARVRRLI